MEVHDEVMPDMGTLMQLKEELVAAKNAVKDSVEGKVAAVEGEIDPAVQQIDLALERVVGERHRAVQRVREVVEHVVVRDDRAGVIPDEAAVERRSIGREGQSDDREDACEEPRSHEYHERESPDDRVHGARGDEGQQRDRPQQPRSGRGRAAIGGVG